MSNTLDLSGLDFFLSNLADEIDAGVEQAAEYVADLERQLAPYDAAETHKHLNESIEVQGEPGSLRREVVAGVGLPDVRAIVQEYGSIYQEAQPYATPAAKAVDLTQEVQQRIDALMARSGI